MIGVEATVAKDDDVDEATTTAPFEDGIGEAIMMAAATRETASTSGKEEEEEASGEAGGVRETASAFKCMRMGVLRSIFNITQVACLKARTPFK